MTHAGKSRILAGAALAALAVPGAALAVPAGGYADLVEELSPAVVFVEVKGKVTPASAEQDDQAEEFFREFQRRFGDRVPPMPERGPRQGVGSGFIVSEDGMIVTNNHVIAGAETVTVKFADGSKHEAKVIGSDPLTDIAVLDIEGDDLPTVEFGSSDDMRVGDEVIAMGNPFGLGGTVTTGIVSAKGRNINAGPFDDFIQTDAAINRGNSGGPLFNAEGEVIGVNTAIISPSGGSAGIGFAVPSDMVRDIVADLSDDGKIDRGWLGVQLKPMSEEVAQVLGFEQGTGAVIERVLPDTPAAEAGLEEGDIVLSFGGTKIESLRDLTSEVAGKAPGEEFDIEVLRKGEKTMLNVTLATRDAEDA